MFRYIEFEFMESSIKLIHKLKIVLGERMIEFGDKLCTLLEEDFISFWGEALVGSGGRCDKIQEHCKQNYCSVWSRAGSTVNLP